MRLRAEYSVGPELKYLSNFDLMHLMQRALRRGGIDYALSQGFNPHIKLSMGTVLPVGLWGLKEYFDLELKADIELASFIRQMNRVLPPAVRIHRSISLPGGEPSLMKMINAASYSFSCRPGAILWDKIAADLESASELIVPGKGKKKNVNKDIRPGIFHGAIENDAGFDIIRIWVSSGSVNNVRFDELKEALSALGMPEEKLAEVYRCGNYAMYDGHFYSPLEKVKDY